MDNTSLLELNDTSVCFVIIHQSYVFLRLICFIFSDCVVHYVISNLYTLSVLPHLGPIFGSDFEIKCCSLLICSTFYF